VLEAGSAVDRRLGRPAGRGRVTVRDLERAPHRLEVLDQRGHVGADVGRFAAHEAAGGRGERGQTFARGLPGYSSGRACAEGGHPAEQFVERGGISGVGHDHGLGDRLELPRVAVIKGLRRLGRLARHLLLLVPAAVARHAAHYASSGREHMQAYRDEPEPGSANA
jgi:hypothetical protein